VGPVTTRKTKVRSDNPYGDMRESRAEDRMIGVGVFGVERRKQEQNGQRT